MPFLLSARPILCILGARKVFLTEFQRDSCGVRRREPRAFGVAALLSLALLALLVLVQVAHVHPLGYDADHCQLCIAMHSAAPVAAQTSAIVLIRFGSHTPFAEARAMIRHWSATLFTRPPPANCQGHLSPSFISA